MSGWFNDWITFQIKVIYYDNHWEDESSKNVIFCRCQIGKKEVNGFEEISFVPGSMEIMKQSALQVKQ